MNLSVVLQVLISLCSRHSSLLFCIFCAGLTSYKCDKFTMYSPYWSVVVMVEWGWIGVRPLLSAHAHHSFTYFTHASFSKALPTCSKPYLHSTETERCHFLLDSQWEKTKRVPAMQHMCLFLSYKITGFLLQEATYKNKWMINRFTNMFAKQNWPNWCTNETSIILEISAGLWVLEWAYMYDSHWLSWTKNFRFFMSFQGIFDFTSNSSNL